MSPGRMVPAARAIRGVVKVPNVYVPGGTPAGHTKLKDRGIKAGGVPVGNGTMLNSGGMSCTAALERHIVTWRAKASARNTSASSPGHPIAVEAGGCTRMTK